MRPRHATTPLTAGRKVIVKSGKRKKRPVVRYSAVPWHGVAAMRNVPQHRGKAGAAGCRRAIPDCNATDRVRIVADRVRSVTEQRTNSGRSNAFWEYCADWLTLGALVFALARRYRSVTQTVAKRIRNAPGTVTKGFRNGFNSTHPMNRRGFRGAWKGYLYGYPDVSIAAMMQCGVWDMPVDVTSIAHAILGT